MLSWLFARRYLFSRKSHSVVNIIACVSTLAVAVPVAAMVILLSVFNGFESLVQAMSSAFDADLTLTAAEGGSFAVDEPELTAVGAVEGVRAVSFTAEQSVLASFGDKGAERRTTVDLKGVDDAYFDVVPIAKTLTAGRKDVRTGDLDFAVAGQGVAYALGIRSLVDADIELYALSRNNFSSVLPLGNYRRRQIAVGGIFALDAQTDSRYVLTSLRAARQLMGYDGRATALEMAVDEGADAAMVARRVAAAAGDRFRVRTREQKNATFYGIMRAEKWGIFLISLLVLLVASFSIVGTLAMLIIEKRDDMRTLAAIGADRGFIRSIFVGEGSLVCFAGAAAGLLLGVGACVVQQRFGLITIPAETFLVTDYPVELRAADVAVVAAAVAVVARAVCELTVRTMIKQV